MRVIRIALLGLIAVAAVNAIWSSVLAQSFGQTPTKKATAKSAKNTPANLPNVPNDVITKLTQARIPAVGQPMTVGGKTCGPVGSSRSGGAPNPKEAALNKNKNRTDNAVNPVPLTWTQLQSLPADKVDQIEGAPIVVTGYLSRQIKIEDKANSTGESTNCYLLTDDAVDWHMYLTATSNQTIAKAIVVETTPRVRTSHHWDKIKLSAYVNKATQIRVTGWLLYDFDHLDVVGTERATVWEVHPITKIEVQINGAWKDTDSLN